MRPAAIWQFCDLPPHYMREVLDGIHSYVNTLRGELIWERILKHTSHCLLGLCWLWNLVLTWNACVGNKITIMVFTCSDWVNIALSTCICTFLWPGVEKITLLLSSTATYKFQFRRTEDLCLFYTPIPCNFVHKNCAKGIDWSMCEGTLGQQLGYNVWSSLPRCQIWLSSVQYNKTGITPIQQIKEPMW